MMLPTSFPTWAHAGIQLAKINIAHAYRDVPVHWHLLGMQRGEEGYVDTALPFGL